uniref:Uncharacterized protein n=1 Tax=Anopheles melas TaxID=34690 RepID=A0A182UHD9_9DIPT
MSDGFEWLPDLSWLTPLMSRGPSSGDSMQSGWSGRTASGSTGQPGDPGGSSERGGERDGGRTLTGTSFALVRCWFGGWLVVVVVVVAHLGDFVLLDGAGASLGRFGGTIALLVIGWQEEVVGAGSVSAGRTVVVVVVVVVMAEQVVAVEVKVAELAAVAERAAVAEQAAAPASLAPPRFSTGLGRTVGVTAFGGGDGRRPAELLYPPVDGLPRLYGGVPKSSMRMCVRFRLEVDRELAVPGTIGLSSGVALERGGSASVTPAAVVVAGGTFSSLAWTGATWGGLVASSSVSCDDCSITVIGGGLLC